MPAAPLIATPRPLEEDEEELPALLIAVAADRVPVFTGPADGIVLCDPNTVALDRFAAAVHRAGFLTASGHAFVVHGRIGKGMWGDVYAAQDSLTWEAYALKAVPRDADVASGLLDVAALRALRHPHIVREFEEFPFQIGHTAFRCIKMEFCGKGTLRQLLKERRAKGKGLPTATVLRYLAQMADALAYVHRNGCLHGDLRSENCLLTWGDDVKLAAFASPTRLLKHRALGMQLTITGGCRTYAPPEWQDSVQVHRSLTALEAPKPSYDMWGLGCVLTEMVTLQLIFGDRVTHFNAVASDPAALAGLRRDVAAAHRGRFAAMADGLLETDPLERTEAGALSDTLRDATHTGWPTAHGWWRHLHLKVHPLSSSPP